MSTYPNTAGEYAPRIKTAGEKYESVAFTFCKVATVALIAERFTLPVAAGLSAILYVMAWFKGKRDTRCILQIPLLIAAFWSVVCVVSAIVIVDPHIVDRLWRR